MKLIILNALFFFLLGSSFAADFALYIIPPKVPISWNSPSELALTTGLNSIRNDYAPIGHFIVELKCEKPNRFGVKHVLTGMERKNRKQSQKITIKSKLGLGSLLYSFDGALQSRKEALHELSLAAADNRLHKIKFNISEHNCQETMSFIEDWIEHGSYQVYGGGKNTMEGEGAGCADFATNLYHIALGSEAPRSWFADVMIPYHLIGKVPYQDVNFIDILKTFSWANNDVAGMPFRIADTNKTIYWLDFIKKNKLPLPEGRKQFVRPAFSFFYPVKISSEQMWKKIKLY
jgi:hypothetical protein